MVCALCVPRSSTRFNQFWCYHRVADAAARSQHCHISLLPALTCDCAGCCVNRHRLSISPVFDTEQIRYLRLPCCLGCISSLQSDDRRHCCHFSFRLSSTACIFRTGVAQEWDIPPLAVFACTSTLRVLYRFKHCDARFRGSLSSLISLGTANTSGLRPL